MKTKLTLLLTALAFATIAPLATAGPDLQTQNYRKQLADSRAVASRQVDLNGSSTENNSKGHPRTLPSASQNQNVTNIAVFKSGSAAKAESCESCSSTQAKR